MNQEAIQEIAAIVASSQTVDFDANGVALPDSVTLHDLERFHPTRRRFRGAFSAQNVDTFAEFVNGRDEAFPSVFIDPENMKATAYFDFVVGSGEPGHCEFTASISPQNLPEYAAAVKANITAYKQRDLLDWLQDWRHCLTARFVDESGENKDIPIDKAIARLRNVDFTATATNEHEEQNFASGRSSMARIAAKAKDGNLPVGFEITVIPYPGFSARVLFLRLGLKNPDSPTFSLTIESFDYVKQQIAEEFQAMTADALSDKASVYIGSFNPRRG